MHLNTHNSIFGYFCSDFAKVYCSFLFVDFSKMTLPEEFCKNKFELNEGRGEDGNVGSDGVSSGGVDGASTSTFRT